MKKILLLLSLSLPFSIFTTDFAEAAYKSTSKTTTYSAMSDLAVYAFKFTVVYDEEYHSSTTLFNNVTYRKAYLHVDRRTPNVSYGTSGTKIYSGNTLVSQTNSFARFYPSQIVPTNTQNLNYRNYETKSVSKGTGKSTNTSSVVLSCSNYVPCIFNQNVTLSY